jgi:DNA-binding SARP family transcriptional activator/nucleoid-associated protein YgaU
MYRRIRGLAAALILITAAVGLPVAVAVTVGNPLHAIGSISLDRASDGGVMAILAVVFYLAWLSFLVPVIVELATSVAARVAHRPQHRLRLPLLGPQQELARTLISAVLLVLPSAATAFSLAAASPPAHVQLAAVAPSADTMQVAHHDGGSSNHGIHKGSNARRHAQVASDRTYVIPGTGGMRSYWALAEHYLGDGQRWHEIWHLNAGRVHADGTVMDTPRRLAAGWTILIPSAHGEHSYDDDRSSPRDVTVEPGDSLSEIAAEHGIDDWHQIWRDNAGRVEPGGRSFDNPDLILPEWTITLPQHPSQHSDGSATPNGATSSGRPANGSRHQSPSAVPPAPAGPRPAADDPKRGAHASSTPSQPAVSRAPAPSSRPDRLGDHVSNSSHSENPIPLPLEVGLAAAAVLVALDRARRIAQRRRRPGHRLPPPPPLLRAAEARLRRGARSSHPATAAVQLAAALTQSRLAVSAVIARDDGAVDLIFDESPPTAPAPFLDRGGIWRLPADDAGFAFAAGDLDDPFPALVPIGRVAEGAILINLASSGPVSIAGDPPAVDRYLTTLVAALAGAPWADRLQIHVPIAIAGQVGALDRVVVEESPVVTHRPASPTQPTSSPRTKGLDNDEWCTTPVDLYCGWTAEDDLDGLLAVSTKAQGDVVVLINGPCPSTTVWTLDETQLSVPQLDEPVTITVDDETTIAGLGLIDHAATAPTVPMGDPDLPDLASQAPPAPEPAKMQLNLLGPVELVGTDHPRRSQTLNLLAYLALHRKGADRDQIATALWPEQVVSGKTNRNRILEARALVGGAITDGPRWRLENSVTTDWQLFTSLAAGEDSDQHAALRLVRGRPFAGLDSTEWIDLEGFRTEVEAAIVDLAISVAERDLDAGDYAAAFSAARSGLAASRYEERLHRLALRAAEAEGSTGKVRTLKREMSTALDLDIEPHGGIEPETLAMYEEMMAKRSSNSDARK